MSGKSDDKPGQLLPAPEQAQAELLSEDLALLWFPVPTPQSPAALTEAEQDIALQVYAGRTNDDIARARGVSARTVGNQLEGIYRKLGVASRVELVLLLRGSSPSR